MKNESELQGGRYLNKLPDHAQKPAVLLVGNFLSSTRGIRTVCEDLAERLVASNWQVLTTSAISGRLNRLLDMMTTVWCKRRQYLAAQVDVYSGAAFLWAEAVGWMFDRMGKPYILTLHGGNLPAFARQWPKRVRRLLSNATVVTAPSCYLIKQMALYRTDIRLLPNPLNLCAYRFKLRKQPRPHLIWLRAFHEIYNPSLALKVLAILIAHFPDIRLTMVGPDKGDGSLRQTRQTAIELDILDRIDFIGGVPKAEVPRLMNRGDIFLNTTNVDNTPRSVLEAMACGLCIVSTNVGGIPYLLEHEHEALLVPPNDPEAMAAAVYRILIDSVLAERLSNNGREKTKQFDWSVILPLWEKLFMAVTNGRIS